MKCVGARRGGVGAVGDLMLLDLLDETKGVVAMNRLDVLTTYVLKEIFIQYNRSVSGCADVIGAATEARRIRWRCDVGVMRHLARGVMLRY